MNMLGAFIVGFLFGAVLIFLAAAAHGACSDDHADDDAEEEDLDTENPQETRLKNLEKMVEDLASSVKAHEAKSGCVQDLAVLRGYLQSLGYDVNVILAQARTKAI